MRKKGNPRFKKVTRRVAKTRTRKGHTTTVYVLKKKKK